jgi:asparagine synthase (glutamine-hydrolysing)
MCGLAGFWKLRGCAGENAEHVVSAMAERIAHRGPDDTGVWCDPDCGIALAHRRLSIIDLSSAGHQPMLSSSGRYVIVFNGEIYNHLTLRADLPKGHQSWRGHSDTETLLAAIDAWGIDKALQASVGMFAFALWDKTLRALYLARDRLGEKPLYYGWQSGVFLFGSELKALRGHAAFSGEIDRRAIALQLRHNYIPAPYSIYRGIHKLLPGCCLKLCAGNTKGELTSYWSLDARAKEGLSRPFKGSAEDAVRELEKLIGEAVSLQMISDVPLGAFLSGGIDSSTIVALMQARATRPVKTFTIGFHEQGYDEAGHAKAVARHLGTDHTELYVTSEQAMKVVPKLPMLYDEPFSDSSQIPTFLVSEMTRRHVIVSLSGDGGDELFCGYDRYFFAQSLWSKIGWMPRAWRQALAATCRCLPPARWDSLLRPLLALAPEGLRNRPVGDRMHKLADLISYDNPGIFYRTLVSHWKSPNQIVIGAKEPETALSGSSPNLAKLEYRMMYLDLLSYLPDDILVKVDRAAMAVSLETRVPLLDHRVVEFAWRLPLSFKIRDGDSKWILRQILYKYVPKELVERPKMGFGVPIDNWLRGPLREWAEDLLDDARLRREGFFYPAEIRTKWRQHVLGQRNWQYYLWDILMFQAWLRAERPAPRT